MPVMIGDGCLWGGHWLVHQAGDMEPPKENHVCIGCAGDAPLGQRKAVWMARAWQELDLY